MTTFPIRPHVIALPRVAIGGAATAEALQRGLPRLVRLNTNEGPFGPFPAAREVLMEGIERLNRYPHPTGAPLAEALAGLYRVDPQQVLVDAGSTQLLMLLAATVLEPGDELVHPWPSFPIYTTVALRLQARPVRVPLADFTLDLEAMLAAITPRTRLVVVCNPNNPTGTLVERGALDAFLARLPDGVIPVLDEAYAEFADGFADGLDYVRQGRPVVVLRTFSKIYGLAGARVGYALGPRELLDACRKLQVPYAVADMALAAAMASVPRQDVVAERAEANRSGLAQLYRGFDALGLQYVPSQANFVFVRIGPGAGDVNRRLTEQGVLVRPGTGYDCPEYFRVTVGTEEENAAFLDALRAALPALVA